MKHINYSKSLLLMMMTLPWFTIPMLGKASFKRFSPSSLLISLAVQIVHFIAKKRKWWWWYEKIHPKEPGGLPFILGPYLVGSLWILKWTYGKFFRYMILNLIVDGAFTYGLTYYLQKFGIAALVRMKKIQLMYVFTIQALLLYGFQFFREKVLVKRV
jgi:hypothetical protein